MKTWAIKRRDNGKWYTGTVSPKKLMEDDCSADKERRFEWSEEKNARDAMRVLFAKGEAVLVRITRPCSFGAWVDAKDLSVLVEYIDDMVLATRDAREFRSALIQSVRTQSRKLLRGS